MCIRDRHRYNLTSSKFEKLGLRGLNTLGDNLLDEIQNVVSKNLERIDKTTIEPKVSWGKVIKKKPVEAVEDELAVG